MTLRTAALMGLLALFLGVPVDVHATALSGIQSIAVGAQHACALTTGGGVKCWGAGDSGEVGDGARTDRPFPTDVSGLSSGVARIAAGINGSMALTSAGGVKYWGEGFLFAHPYEGLVVEPVPVDVPGLASGVQSISAGSARCAVTTSGGAKCWGQNAYGQLGDGTTNSRTTVADVTGLTSGVVAISAGVTHTCALMAGGTVKCWGENSQGQLGDGTTTDRLTPVDVAGLSGIVAISAGQQVTCALTSTGGVKCWGWNLFGAVGDGTNTMRTTPVDVVGLASGVAAISTGVTACALTTGGGVKCWGANHVGQLGDGSTVISRNTPGDVPGLNGVVGVSTLGGSVCAVLGDTRVRCWGQNTRGQLGNPGAAGYESTPVFVVVSLAAQSISFPPLPARNLSAGAFTPTATSTSGLAVTFRSLTTSICSASGSTVTPLAIGICRIAADQPGDKLDWAPASTVLREFLVTGTAAGAPPRLANISTRMQVQLGDNVLIAGFAIYGNSQKTVVIRARGPSLASVGVSNVLADPQLQLYSGQTPIGSNDDWQTSGSATTLQEIGLAPSDPREPAFVTQLNSGLYTVIVRGAQATTGVATIEVFEIDNAAVPLVNLSTRGLVLTGDDVMIAGFIIHGNDPQTVVVNVAGPSLGRAGLSNTLADPTLTLVRSADNTIIATNDNWVSAPNASQIQASGFAPGHSLEPAIMMTLAPGAYTAIVRGVGGGTGIALVGVFAVP